MQESTDDRAFDFRWTFVDHGVSLGLIALVVLLAYQVFAPLFPSILWGLLLAVICAHPYERLVSRLKGRRAIADVVLAALLLLVLILPALFFAWELVVNFPVLSEWLHTAPLPEPPPWLADLPVVGPTLKEALGAGFTDFGEKIPGIASHLGGLASWAAIRIGTFGSFLAEFLLGTVVALFILHNRFAVRAFMNRLLRKTGGEFAGGSSHGRSIQLGRRSRGSSMPPSFRRCSPLLVSMQWDCPRWSFSRGSPSSLPSSRSGRWSS